MVGLLPGATGRQSAISLFKQIEAQGRQADSLSALGVTSAARSLLDDTTVAAMRTTLALAGNDLAFTVAQSITISGAGNALSLVSTDAGASDGPIVEFYRNSGTPSNNDVLGGMYFYGNDSAGNKQAYAGIINYIVRSLSGSENGAIQLYATKAGTYSVLADMGSSALGNLYAIFYGSLEAVSITENGTALTAKYAQLAVADTFAEKATFTKGLSVGSTASYTIASDAITLTTAGLIQVDTQSAAATDDLSTISGGAEGDIIIVFSADASRDVTLKDNTGNLRLAGDFTLSHTQDRITLVKVSSNWFELARSDNA